jgi:hypothetical protein
MERHSVRNRYAFPLLATLTMLALPLAAAHTPFVCGQTQTITAGDGGAGALMTVTYLHMTQAPASLRGFDLVVKDALGQSETVHVPGPAGKIAWSDFTAAGESEFRIFATTGHANVEVTFAKCVFA